MTVGARIAEFRNSRGLSQSALGAIGGVTRLTQGKYESGATSPTADYLWALHEQGADLLYIVTGEASGGVLSESETQVLGFFRALTSEEQGALLLIIGSMAGRPARGQVLHNRSEGYQVKKD